MEEGAALETALDRLNRKRTVRWRHSKMSASSEYDELIDYLRREGQTDAEIEKILARVRQYEVEMKQDSIMDAIGDGSIDLAALIKEALES